MIHPQSCLWYSTDLFRWSTSFCSSVWIMRRRFSSASSRSCCCLYHASSSCCFLAVSFCISNETCLQQHQLTISRLLLHIGNIFRETCLTTTMSMKLIYKLLFFWISKQSYRNSCPKNYGSINQIYFDYP